MKNNRGRRRTAEYAEYAEKDRKRKGQRLTSAYFAVCRPDRLDNSDLKINLFDLTKEDFRL
jgi:hypothetical protein